MRNKGTSVSKSSDLTSTDRYVADARADSPKAIFWQDSEAGLTAARCCASVKLNLSGMARDFLNG